MTDQISCLFLRGQLAAARQNGFDVALLCSTGALATRISEEEGALFLPVRMRRTPAPPADIVALMRVWSALRRFRPDLVNAGTPKAGLLVMIAASLLRVRCRIYTLHGLRLETASGARRWLLRSIEWLTCSLADSVVCVSPSVRARAVALGLVSSRKATVLGDGSCNGVDLVRFAPTTVVHKDGSRVRAMNGIRKDDLVVGFVGRLVRDKGVIELMAAWGRIRETFGTANLLIVGWLEDALPEPLCRLLEQDPRIHVVGPVEENIEAYYGAMDVLALPTYREGLPTVLLEAGAMGVPVVATRVTGCVDVIEDGVTGTLVDAQNADELSDAIGRYLRDGDLRVRHGKAAQARMQRCFSRQRVWDALHGEYARLIESRMVRASSPFRIERVGTDGRVP